jgi:hypothetical protein
MEIVTKEQVNRLIQNKKEGEYASAIRQLEKGAALCISTREWKRRTSIPYYFLGKFNRNRKMVSCQKVGDFYFIIKL